MFSASSFAKLAVYLIQVFLFPDKVCDISKLYDFLTMHVVSNFLKTHVTAVYKRAILYQSEVVSIETKKKVMRTLSGCVFHVSK